jgi:hypothetical protein
VNADSESVRSTLVLIGILSSMIYILLSLIKMVAFGPSAVIDIRDGFAGLLGRIAAEFDTLIIRQNPAAS